MTHQTSQDVKDLDDGSYSLYPPVFSSLEEEYSYVLARMAELEQKLGQSCERTKAGAQAQPDEGKKSKRRSLKVLSRRSKKTTSDPKDQQQKKKKKKAKKVKETPMDCTSSELPVVGKEEPPGASSTKAATVGQPNAVEEKVMAVNGATETTMGQPKLRKAASFLFNKTSEVKAYFRRMSAEIKDMPSKSSSPKETPGPSDVTVDDQPPQTSDLRRHLKRLNKKGRNRPRSGAVSQSGEAAEDDLNDLSSTGSNISGSAIDVTYDPRYTDAVFMIMAATDWQSPHGSHVNISDHETFSIMIEEDSTTYGSPTMLPEALPEGTEIELEEEEKTDSSTASTSRSTSSYKVTASSNADALPRPPNRMSMPTSALPEIRDALMDVNQHSQRHQQSTRSAPNRNSWQIPYGTNPKRGSTSLNSHC